MITVNGEGHPWHGGLTVRQLLKEKNYIFPMIIVKINDRFIPRTGYDGAAIADGDDVWVIHLISGG